jgi:hypothetical protein
LRPPRPVRKSISDRNIDCEDAVAERFKPGFIHYQLLKLRNPSSPNFRLPKTAAIAGIPNALNRKGMHLGASPF